MRTLDLSNALRHVADLFVLEEAVLSAEDHVYYHAKGQVLIVAPMRYVHFVSPSVPWLLTGVLGPYAKHG
jgi:hypothetical protein